MGKERFIKQVSEMKGLPKCRVVSWSEGNGEIFSGNQNGKITFWDPRKGEAISVLDAHTDTITQIQWFEKSRYLFTCSKDKFIKVWEIPKEWLKEEEPE